MKTSTPLDAYASFEFRASTWTRPDPSDDFGQVDARADIETAMNAAGLTDRERTVLRVRFFEGGTLIDAGAAIKATKEFARQVQIAALEKLRHSLNDAGLSL